MNIAQLQGYLVAGGFLPAPADGIAGRLTKAAAKALLLQQGVDGDRIAVWNDDRRIVGAKQLVCRLVGIEVGQIDGLMGPQTTHAFDIFDARAANGGKVDPTVENWRDDATAPQAVPSRALPTVTSSQVNAPATRPQWPKQNAAAMDAFFGPKGTNQTTLTFPYPMRLAWNLDSVVRTTSCNKHVRESLERIFARTLDFYGIDRVKELRLDLFGGCLNVRKMRGSATAWSIHSWGCAIDIDPEHNALKMHRAQATLDNPPFDQFWSFVYDEGAIGLGRERDYDWMHAQFARL